MGAVRAASPARRCPIPHGCDRQKCRLRQAQPTPSPPPVALPSGAPVYPSDSFPFLMITTICSIAASPKLRDLGSLVPSRHLMVRHARRESARSLTAVVLGASRRPFLGGRPG